MRIVVTEVEVAADGPAFGAPTERAGLRAAESGIGAVIAALDDAVEAVAGRAGTRIEPDGHVAGPAA